MFRQLRQNRKGLRRLPRLVERLVNRRRRLIGWIRYSIVPALPRAQPSPVVILYLVPRDAHQPCAHWRLSAIAGKILPRGGEYLLHDVIDQIGAGQ